MQRPAPRAPSPPRSRRPDRARRGTAPRGNRDAPVRGGVDRRRSTGSRDARRAPVTARSTGSPTRTRRSASSARSRRSSWPAPRTSPARCCSLAATRCCAPASPTPPAQRSPQPARWRCDATTMRCSREAALGFAGLGIAIVDLDVEAIARLEEALERVEDRRCAPACRRASPSSSITRPDRTRSEALQRRGRRHGRARQATQARSPLPSSARHVALWRPDRVEERLAVAGEMIAAAREAARPPCRAAGSQLARRGPVRAWRHAGLAGGDRAARAAGRGAPAAGVPVVHAAVGGGRRRCSPAATTTSSA